MKNWLVVANASRARVLEETDPPGAYAHVADLVHPQSQLKGEQLGTDRPGHVEGTGHGLGLEIHEDPRVTRWRPDIDVRREHLEAGMVFTIEPMLTLGDIAWDMWSDGWTVTTKDKSWTAQFEHTLVVTESGYEILTLP